ncbi:MAG: crossover junction endodeoxyribonuclease RuvC [Ruminococcus sp.]|nr:crossover junction endodeoxyribonuclease RuvC [Ruminococcus sp.]
MKKVRILGVDPGYAIVGFGVVDYDGFRFSLVEYGAVLTEADTPFPQRLRAIRNDMEFIFGEFSPDVMAIEKLYFNTNHTTGIDVAQARGVTLLSAAERDVPIYEYTPLQVKSAVVGYGKAEKKQVMEMTRQILGLVNIPKPDDAADALAIAICHGHSTRWG